MPHPDLQLFTMLTTGALAASGPWVRLPYADAPRFEVADLPARWPQLHAGRGLQPPAPGPLAEGWALYHSGEFERAAAFGLLHGPEGLALANQATAVYANYLESREGIRLTLFKQVIERASLQCQREPDNCDALYWQAYALSGYSQGISVARALAQGLGDKIKDALERVIALQPTHADAHIALAAFHAEVIDKVGPLVGHMTYGVRADAALELFDRGLALHPRSASGLMEYGRGLLMLHGDSHLAEATRLYREAAALEPADARERLDVELAKAGLSECA